MTEKEFKAIQAAEKEKTVANLNIERYTDNGMFCAYIGDVKGGSGIKVVGDTTEELANNMKEYIVEYFQS